VCVGSLFLVLRARTHFRRCRGRRVPFSCFAHRLVCGCTEGIRSHFHLLRSRTNFRRYRGRRVPFSSFALPDSFSTRPRAWGPVFMFCAPELIFGGTEGVGSVFMFCAPGLVFGDTEGVGFCFDVLLVRTRFRRYRGRWVPFSCFASPDSILMVPRASGPVFMFCVPGLIFDGTERVGSGFLVLRVRNHFRRYRGVGSRFHVLCARTHFRLYLGRRVPFSFFALPVSFQRRRVRRFFFSCFAPPDSFSTDPRASCPVFMFCALLPIFGGSEGVGFLFSYFSGPDSFSAVQTTSGPVFMFCAHGLVFGCTECVRSRFHVLRSRTHFRRDRGRGVPFSCFVLPNSFSAVPRVSGLFSCFARPDSFSAVPRASTPVFIFFASGLIFSCTDGVWSGFHVLHSRTHFQRCRVRPFSCFAHPN
jgi:hypothetical protein